jgi:hypothetical protein
LPCLQANSTLPADPWPILNGDVKRMPPEMRAKQDEDDHWFSVPHLLVFLLLWATVHAIQFMIRQPDPLLGAQIDPDGYMRLVRVGMLLDGGHWFDTVVARSNWPFGEVLHWTRPLDILLIALAVPLGFFLDDEAGLALAGMVISPLCHLALCVASVWIVHPLVSGPERFLAMPAMMAQRGILLYSEAGRADHHAVIFLLAGLALGAWLRVLLNPKDASSAVLAGIISGMGVWVSPESLLPLGLLFASGGVAWILHGRRFLSANRRLCLGLAGALVVAILIERDPAHWLEVAFDRISLAHVSMSLIALGFWWVMSLPRESGSRAADQPSNRPIAGPPRIGWATRLLMTVGGALLATGLLRWMHPGFFSGPWVDVDPAVVDVWLAHVQELQPLLPRDGADLGRFLMHLGPAMFLIPLLARWLKQEWRTHRGPAWILLFLSLLVYVPLAAIQVRFSAYAGIVFSILLVETVRRLLDWARTLKPENLVSTVRVLGTTTVLIGHLVLGMAFSSAARGSGGSATIPESGQPQDECSLTRMTRILTDPEGLGAEPLTVVAFIDFGPELLYRTPHRTLAGPYHRNYQGILGAYRFLTSTNDLEMAALAREREIDLILLCPSKDRYYFGREGQNTLYNRLLREEGPAWMRILLSPEAPAGFFLFRVDRSEIAPADG